MEINSSNPLNSSTSSTPQIFAPHKKRHQRSNNALSMDNDPLRVQSAVKDMFVDDVSGILSTSTRSSRASSISVSAAEADRASRTLLVPKQDKENKRHRRVSVSEADRLSRTIASSSAAKESGSRLFRFSGSFKKSKLKRVEAPLQANSVPVLKESRQMERRNLKNRVFFDLSGALFHKLCHEENPLIDQRIQISHKIMELQNKILRGESDDREGLAFARQELEINAKALQELLAESVSRWKNAAKQHLEDGTFPQHQINNFVDAEETAIEMARLLLSKNPAQRISEGSGGVYLIGEKDKTPLFVFKPLDESFGAENCPNKDPKLVIVNDRLLQEDRFGFPLSEDSFREYALSVIFPKSMLRVLANLRLSDEKKAQPGILTEYKGNLFTIQKLTDHVQLQVLKRKLQAQPAGLDVQRLESGIKELEQSLDSFADLSKEQKEEIEWHADAFLAKHPEANIVAKPQLSLWNLSTSQSVNQMLLELLTVPNFDPNAGNFLLKRVSNSSNYEIVLIDWGQAFSDTMSKSINSPPFLGAERFDEPINLSKSFTEQIKYLNAYTILDLLKKKGIFFQELAHKIIHPDTGEEIEVGGDLLNNIKAFHKVAKIGCMNGNSFNEVFSLLYHQGKIHHLFSKAKQVFAGNEQEQRKILAHPDFQDLMLEEDYKDFFPENFYAPETKKLWKIFEGMVLESLNKTKSHKRNTHDI